MSDPRETLKAELKRLRRFAFSLTGNIADADDLVHDVAIKALEKGLPGGDPVPWLITITKNLWLDRLRQQEVRERPETLHQLAQRGEDSGPADSLHTEQILHSLAALPEHYRLALTLVAVEGLSYAEVSALLKVPTGTVMSRVARAREQLLKALESGELNEER